MRKNNPIITNKFEATMLACSQSRMLENRKRKKSTKSTIKENKRRFTESDEEDIVDGVEDDIIVVTDPELDPEDLDAHVDELQDIVDDTPEGETPTTDEYIDDLIYTCPVCGNSFFSDTEMTEGDTCPVCGEIPDAFVLVGDVEESGETSEDEGEEDFGDEDLEIDDNEEEIEEKYSRGRKRKTESSIYVDEKSFNPLLTKFIKENYKNASSMRVKRAIMSGRNIRLECLIKYKSGNTRKSTVTIENFKKSPKLTMNCKLDSTFKVESRSKNSVVFSGKLISIPSKKASVIKAESMRYNFISRNENCRYQVTGSHKILV